MYYRELAGGWYSAIETPQNTPNLIIPSTTINVATSESS
jgi:hypothetical protein